MDQRLYGITYLKSCTLPRFCVEYLMFQSAILFNSDQVSRSFGSEDQGLIEISPSGARPVRIPLDGIVKKLGQVPQEFGRYSGLPMEAEFFYSPETNFFKDCDFFSPEVEITKESEIYTVKFLMTDDPSQGAEYFDPSKFNAI